MYGLVPAEYLAAYAEENGIPLPGGGIIAQAPPAPEKPLLAPNHCPLHQWEVLLPSIVRVTANPTGDATLVGEGEAGWCSQCDLEVEWARQRPHLEMV